MRVNIMSLDCFISRLNYVASLSRTRIKVSAMESVDGTELWYGRWEYERGGPISQVIFVANFDWAA